MTERAEDEEGYWEAMGGRERSFRNELLNLKPVNIFQPVKAVITVVAESSSFQLLAGMNSPVSPSIHTAPPPSITPAANQEESLGRDAVAQLSSKEAGKSEHLSCSFGVTGIRLIYRTCVRAGGQQIIKILLVQP